MTHPHDNAAHPSSLTRYAWLSIGAALVTIGLKTLAYQQTGSVGLLSDALESLVNLAAAGLALGMLMIAARPPDADHAYGHGKAEYFAGAIEGLLILVAAASIGATAWGRLLDPQPIEQVGIGLALSTAASLVNLGVARVLLRAGRRHGSIALEADGQHLMTDVWTSAGVLAGIGLVTLTGWTVLDPLIALLVAANIVWTGVQLVRRSTHGLMDAALDGEDQARVVRVLDRYAEHEGIGYHALRTRQAGARRFVSFHVIVPGSWTVQQGHQLLEQIERDVRALMPNTTVFTHLEPLDDPTTWLDESLDRDDEPVVYA
ncbi:MAG TPA: cation diffusion facilitator family transporter [Roseiflexaceae bacterium]|nr:cation diffusion facilitator family transporter [Roseiflexaceae bacterium]